MIKSFLRTLKEAKLIRFGKKGELDDEDYFTLENSGVPKILAANSEINGYITDPKNKKTRIFSLR